MSDQKSVYQRLMQVRVALQSMPLKKSGHNRFAGYSYFELADFLPSVQQLFLEHGLCDVITFERNGEGDMEAVMRIFDVASSDCIVLRSPFGSAQLKGCHEVQNIGAVETYQRRYLYTTALAISEHDALDASQGAAKAEDKPKAEKPKAEKPEGMTEEDCALFVEKLTDWGTTCESAGDLVELWKGNQTQIEQVKKYPPLMEKLTASFKELKAKF